MQAFVYEDGEFEVHWLLIGWAVTIRRKLSPELGN